MSQIKQSHSGVNCVDDVHQQLHEEYVSKVHESGYPVWVLDMYGHQYVHLFPSLGKGEVVERIIPAPVRKDLPF